MRLRGITVIVVIVVFFFLCRSAYKLRTNFNIDKLKNQNIELRNQINELDNKIKKGNKFLYILLTDKDDQFKKDLLKQVIEDDLDIYKLLGDVVTKEEKSKEEKPKEKVTVGKVMDKII